MAGGLVAAPIAGRVRTGLTPTALEDRRMGATMSVKQDHRDAADQSVSHDHS
jgi:hypothetical protein